MVTVYVAWSYIILYMVWVSSVVLPVNLSNIEHITSGVLVPVAVRHCNISVCLLGVLCTTEKKVQHIPLLGDVIMMMVVVQED